MLCTNTQWLLLLFCFLPDGVAVTIDVTLPVLGDSVASADVEAANNIVGN